MKRSMILYIVPVLLLAFNAYGGRHGKYHGQWRWWEDESMVTELKLNDEQVAKLEEISSSYKEQLDELRTGVVEKRTSFNDAMGNPDSTRDDITKAYDEMWDAKYKMKKAKLEMKLDMRGVLNPDQITKMSEIKEQHKQKMMEKHHKL